MYTDTKFHTFHPCVTLLWVFSLLMFIGVFPALAQGQDEGEAEEPIIVTDAGGYQSAERDRTLGTDLAGVRDDTPPASPSLLGNYPNPFNPTTTISFNLPEAQPVRLAVYNVLGQLVQVLADGPMEAGRHEVRFLADNLPSGLYLARLASPSGVIVRSMLLTK